MNVRIQGNGELAAAMRRTHGKEQVLQPLADWVWEQRRAGRRILVTCRTRPQAERLASLLSPYGLQFERSDG
ncbi:MAG: hypothetical protein HGA66_10040, partial [Holophaga sp.]|nr:hypothetical protein [Holophaga sp.]